jgi:predicted amidohydrolase
MLRRTLLAALGAASHAQSDVPRFTIAGLCVVPDRWEKEANLRKLDRYARQAAAQGAKVIVTPEGFLDGYVGNDRDLERNRYRSVAEPIQGSAIQRVRKLAAELKVFLAIGFSELRDELVFNTVAIFGPDGSLVSRYSKTHCGGEPHNTEGREFPVVQTILGRWGTMICLDRQLPETARILAIKGAQMILNPSYGMYGEMNDVMMRTRAYENAVYVVFVHPKRCLVIDPKGKILSSNRGEGDQVVLAPIVLDERIGTGPIRSRRPEIYGEILKRN